MDKVKVKKNRIWELDFLRGFAIIMMCFDHFMYDLAFLPHFFKNFSSSGSGFLVSLSNLATNYWTWSVRLLLHPVFYCLFFILVGISCTLSKSNVKRAMKILVFAAILSLGIFMFGRIIKEEMVLIFGVLHCIGVSILITALIKKIFSDNKYAYLVSGIIVIVIGYFISNHFNVIYYEEDFKFSFESFFRIVIGNRAYGEDTFGLFPYMGVILIGAFLGKSLYEEKMSIVPALESKFTKPFNFVGRNTIWIYLLHQPVCAVIIFIIFFIVGYRM